MFTVKMVGDSALVARLEEMSPAVAAALEVKVRAYTYKLAGYIQQEKLQGQVLNHRSGRLSRSITPEMVEATQESIIGRVFSSGDVKYAAFWEFGFSGSEQVRAFTRTTTNLFGREVEAFTQEVRAHTRNVNQAARSFMRTSIREMAAEIEQGLMRTAVKAMQTSDPTAGDGND